MPFGKGKPKTGGRRPGSVNRFTGAFRDAVQTVYNGLGGHPAFLQWARKNKTAFYKIAARLIPVEIHGFSDQSITVIVQRQTAPMLDAPRALPDHSIKEAAIDGDQAERNGKP